MLLGYAALSCAEDEQLQRSARHLLYVALPGSTEGPAYRNGLGVVVLDADDHYSFVKRIPTWDVSASMSPEVVTGVTASPVTNLMYVATQGRLGALDLATDKMVWSNAYDGKCCERPQITANGKIIVVGSDKSDFWYVVDGTTGKLLTKIQTPSSTAAHNLNFSADDRLAFMAPIGNVMSIAGMDTLEVVKTITFGEALRPFVINHDASRIYANVNELLGFEVADVASGRVIERVEVPGSWWKEKWNGPQWRSIPHGCPSHGIALTPDEKEVWVVDGINNYIHIFDITGKTPRFADSIKTTAGPYWITMDLDGRFAFISSGDIVDIKSHRVVGQTRDEFGRQMGSEKVLDMAFVHGRLRHVANQFGNGRSVSGESR